MKKFLLTLITVFVFWIWSEIFAQNITRYSEYSEDWTLDKQLFDLWNENLDFNSYKQNTFNVSVLSWSICWDDEVWWNIAEYWENFQWKWRLEIVWNNSTEATFWKFKPWKEFVDLYNEDFIEFCYWSWSTLNNKIKIKKYWRSLSLKTVWNWDQKKVVISKAVWDN